MNFPSLSKRQKFVLAAIFLSLGMFISFFFSGWPLVLTGFSLSTLTVLSLFLIIREDIKGTFYLPLFVLPFFYSMSFTLFYLLTPQRLLSRIISTGLFAFGLYSMFLTQNIFAVSSTRTIVLLRSARIVSFVLTILVLFFLINFIFSLRLPVFLTPIVVSLICFFLNFQSLWIYGNFEKSAIPEILLYSTFITLSIFELSVILIFWPVSSAIYSIFLTGIFYIYSGLSHAWIEKRLFRGIMWEYIWVGFLSILILFVFSGWGI